MPVAKDNQFWDALMENKVAKKLIKKHKSKAKCENIDELASRYQVAKSEVEKVSCTRDATATRVRITVAIF